MLVHCIFTSLCMLTKLKVGYISCQLKYTRRSFKTFFREIEEYCNKLRLTNHGRLLWQNCCETFAAITYDKLLQH